MTRREILLGGFTSLTQRSKPAPIPRYRNGYCPVCGQKHDPIGTDDLHSTNTGMKGAMVVCGRCFNIFWYMKED